MLRPVFWYVNINVSEEFAFTIFHHISPPFNSSQIYTQNTGTAPLPPHFLSMYPAILTSVLTAVFISTAMRSPIPNQKPPNEKFKRQSQFVETHVRNNSKSDLKIILNTFNQTFSVEILTLLGLSLRIYASCLPLCY